MTMTVGTHQSRPANTAVNSSVVTTDQLLAMPDDGIDRELISGELKERDMTCRNPSHSFVEASVARILGNWSMSQPLPRGRVYSGEVGFRIRSNPDTTVGIDVAYVDSALALNIPKHAVLIEGPPVLAIEILSPSDKQEDILAKFQEYLSCGTKAVILLETVFETATVFRPDVPPTLLTGTQQLSVEPHLPGFRCEVRKFFAS